MVAPCEGKLVVKHTFLEFVHSPSQRRRRSATEGALTIALEAEECECSDEGESLIQHLLNVSSFSSATSDESDILHLPDKHLALSSGSLVAARKHFVDDVPLDHPLLQENVRLLQENAELRALRGNTSEPSVAMQIEEPRLHPMTGEQRDMNLAVVVMPITSFPILDFSASHPQIMFQQSQHQFDQSSTEHHHPIGNESRALVDHMDHTMNASSPEHSTTVMLRNLPNMYDREMLVELLNSEGFEGKFTFLYLPIDFKSHAGLGYAFVDMESPAEAERIRQHFEGFSRWILSSEKVCTVCWSLPEQQGLSAHIERYRNSPVMHKSVPDEWRPILLSAGMRTRFPPPTRKIRAPRIRPGAFSAHHHS
jgi:hypothetical protein